MVEKSLYLQNYNMETVYPIFVSNRVSIVKSFRVETTRKKFIRGKKSHQTNIKSHLGTDTTKATITPTAPPTTKKEITITQKTTFICLSYE